MSNNFNTKKRSLRGEVKRAIKRYYRNLDGENPIELYELTLSQIEPPLLEVVLKKCRGNQSQACQILGLNRGTLRKKMAKYGLL
tara:strand:+ start:323 stop:574 length:252 start_codon:yes stop_codon:yes gene_type:complete